jgi:hypothetical protein
LGFSWQLTAPHSLAPTRAPPVDQEFLEKPVVDDDELGKGLLAEFEEFDETGAI